LDVGDLGIGCRARCRGIRRTEIQAVAYSGQNRRSHGCNRNGGSRQTCDPTMPSYLLGALVDPGDRGVASDREILQRTS
jgi:hypothetical protein